MTWLRVTAVAAKFAQVSLIRPWPFQINKALSFDMFGSLSAILWASFRGPAKIDIDCIKRAHVLGNWRLIDGLIKAKSLATSHKVLWSINSLSKSEFYGFG